MKCVSAVQGRPESRDANPIPGGASAQGRKREEPRRESAPGPAEYSAVTARRRRARPTGPPRRRAVRRPGIRLLTNVVPSIIVVTLDREIDA